ncbi:hypothetical protein BGZ73_007224 [Actinomortierella ambigua]|nr:hypothetical protein BGZ73_007224 [Actinomortierella ambigua]
MTKSASSTARRNGAQATNSSSRSATMPTFRGRDVVFVDPLDDKESYWWPAMIVPIPEIDPSMDCTVLNPGECLVKYFEDNKYSVVKFTELQPFIPTTIPFLEFESSAGQKFLKSGGVINALAYLESGKVKRKFSWQYWGTAKDDELDLTHEKQKPLRLPLKKHDESPASSSSSSSSSSTASNGHGKKGSTPGPSTATSNNHSTIPTTTSSSSASKDSAPSSFPAAARKRTAKHSASHDLTGDADKALSPSRKRFSTPTALDTTATTTDTSSSASTPVTPDQAHLSHHQYLDTKNGSVTVSEKNSPVKTASATGGATGHPRARSTGDSIASQAQTSAEQSQEHEQLEQLQQHHQPQTTKGGRKRKARTNSTPSSSVATSPSIPTTATLTDEPEEIKSEDNISPTSTVGVKRTRSATAISSSATPANSNQDTNPLSATIPPPPSMTQPSSAASSPTQPAPKRRRGKTSAANNSTGSAHAESVSPSSAPSSRAGSRHGSVDLGTHPNAPLSPTVGRASRSSKQGATHGQHSETDSNGVDTRSDSDASGQPPSTTTSMQEEQEMMEVRSANGAPSLPRLSPARSTPELGSSALREANMAAAGGKKGRGTKHTTLSIAANGEHHGTTEGEHDQESSSSLPSMSASTSVSSDQVQQEQKVEKQEADDDARLVKDRRRMKLETDSDTSSPTSSSPTLSVAMSMTVSNVSMELDAFGLERRDMVHKMQTVLPTLPMGSKEREAMYESCMDHLQKLRKEHQRLRQILQMTGTTLDRRHKGGRKSSPSLSVSSGRSYRSYSRQQQNGVAKDYHERSSSPTVNGSRPSRAGTNRFYGRTR